MSKETFTWTDELIKEMLYRHFPFGPEFIPLQNTLDNFKQSKMPKKEWEVIEVISRKGGKLTKQRNEISWEQWGLKSFYGLKINAVKRLSDGEVFKVGEDVEYSVNGDPTEIYYTGVIKDIKIPYPSNNEIMCLIKGVSHPDESLYFVDKIRHPKFPPQKEQSKPEQPKRIEVIDFRFDKTVNIGQQYVFVLERYFPVNKKTSSQIKAAIERVLNDDEDDGCRITTSPNLYTTEALREAEEKAFIESRLTNSFLGFKHNSFKDYLKSKQQ